MKINPTVKHTLIGVCLLSLAACSSTRHGNDVGAPGAIGGEGGNGGAYAEGTGGGAGFQPATSCNVPQAGSNTQSYYFAYDSNDVHSEDMSRIQSSASNIASSHSNVRVIGNTDNRGSREYNVALGWRRANAVATVLEQSGVSKQQVNASSNGAEKPIAFGSSEDDFQCNRRVDVVSK